MIPIPSSLIEFILLGPLDDRRQLQDSPILGDVWVAFGKAPAGRLDLLIAPYRGEHAGAVAANIHKALGSTDDLANIAFLQGLVVAKLTFDEVMRVVTPKTEWWIKKWKADPPPAKQEKEGEPKPSDPSVVEAQVHDVMKYTLADLKSLISKKILAPADAWHKKTGKAREYEVTSLERFLALTALITWAAQTKTKKATKASESDPIKYILKDAIANIDQICDLLLELRDKMLGDKTVAKSKRKPLVWQVSLNRRAMPALSRSVPAVKADAAKTLFKVNCKDIGWAVLDSGIYGDHPAFQDDEGASRVKKTFDFKNFRTIVSLSNSDPGIREKNVTSLLKDKDLLKNPPTEGEANKDLERLAQDAENQGPVHWELVEKFVAIKNTDANKPQTNHGTHVAGIIGANKNAVIKASGNQDNEDFADGMCPDISLYDFRVLGTDIAQTEFAVIAALQFIRYLNDRDNFFTIHGANLSLSIPHDVRNFACGRTPVCEECERLIASGVVVVAAAGNHGYKSFETKEGSYDSYAAFSITDPGNADAVLTVGATHRFWPHTYGVSFFSSRGPTGDGRLKPDLVAPGERIRAPVSGGDSNSDWDDLDGTSMAAPHVSGAAAMLMARYSELIGQPLRIKRILCESATDLGRERSFQGHGMLDVLRAFQSI